MKKCHPAFFLHKRRNYIFVTKKSPRPFPFLFKKVFAPYQLSRPGFSLNFDPSLMSSQKHYLILMIDSIDTCKFLWSTMIFKGLHSVSHMCSLLRSKDQTCSMFQGISNSLVALNKCDLITKYFHVFLLGHIPRAARRKFSWEFMARK